MNVLGIIPARGGSKAIPRKNLVELGGKPLIQWTIEAAQKSTLSHLVVSTDDLEIAEFAKSLNVDVPGLRPAHLATDDAKTIDVVLHVLQEFPNSEAVMILQPTSPFRTTDDIEAALRLLAISDSDSVISVVTVGGLHPARMKYLEGTRLIDPPFAESTENQRRQNLKPVFVRNGAIYLTRSDVIKRGSLKGHYSTGYVMPEERSIDIDDHFDLRVARALLIAR